MTFLKLIDAAIAVASLFGSMLFFFCVVAPLTFAKLASDMAGHFLRSLFRW